jgi:hypothetical protein
MQFDQVSCPPAGRPTLEDEKQMIDSTAVRQHVGTRIIHCDELDA